MAEKTERTNADALNELVNSTPNGLKPQIDSKLDKNGTAKSAEKLTGESTAPTPEEGDNSNKVATTAFVNNLVSKLLSFADEDLNTFVEIVENIKTLRNSKASTSNFGMVKVGSNIDITDGTISLTKRNVVNALGYTPPESAASIPLYSGTGTNTNGSMTQKATTDELDNKLNKTDAAATYMAKTDMPITVEESQTTIEHELTIPDIGPRPSKIALTSAGRTQLDGNNIEGYAENMVEFAAGNRICLSKSYNQFFLLNNDMFLLQHGENQIWSTSSGISIATKSGGGLHVNGTKIA